MGQAKLRGSRQERVEEALRRREALKPDQIVCNNCHAILKDLKMLDTRSMKGIKAAFGAYCTACDNVTFAVNGDPDAVAELYEVMESEVGPDLKTGYIPKPGDSE